MGENREAFLANKVIKQKPAIINIIWLFLIVSSIVAAAYTGRMKETTEASFESVKSAVTLALSWIGIMAFWLGIMKVAEAGGLMQIIAKLIRPLMIKLFPEVPANHPAMAAMIMNFAANMLGLGNAATPMGIKAMQELDKLNPQKGTATNAMCLFLAMNTSSLALLPLGVIGVRAAAGATNPGAIFFPSLFATACSTATAIIAAKLLGRRSRQRSIQPAVPCDPAPPSDLEQTIAPLESPNLIKPTIAGRIVMLAAIIAFVGAVGLKFMSGNIPSLFSQQFMLSFSNWLIPVLIGAFLLFGYFRGVKVYEALTDGAKEGFNVAIKIIPFLVAVFAAIGMFRASGALDIFIRLFGPLTSKVGMPAEALSMVILRPLSGSGAFALMSEIVKQNPDSFLSYLVSTMQGSTETTFYVLAVYFGSVGIVRTRYALSAGLLADAAGFIASVAICRLLF